MPERAVSIDHDRASGPEMGEGATQISTSRPLSITGRPGRVPGRGDGTRSSSAAGSRSRRRGIRTRRHSRTRRGADRHIRPNVPGVGRAGAVVDHPNRGQARGRGAVAAVGPIPGRLHSRSGQASQWQVRQQRHVSASWSYPHARRLGVRHVYASFAFARLNAVVLCRSGLPRLSAVRALVARKGRRASCAWIGQDCGRGGE